MDGGQGRFKRSCPLFSTPQVSWHFPCLRLHDAFRAAYTAELFAHISAHTERYFMKGTLMKTTIKELARIAGVSIATVSHVINKTRYVSPELVEKVENAIKQTGYTSRMQNSGKTMIGARSIVAVVLPFLSGSSSVRLIEYTSEILSDKGYLVSVYYSQNNESLEKNILLRLCEDKNIRGIIIYPCNPLGKYYTKLRARRIPVVTIGQKPYHIHADHISDDNETAIYKAIQHLIKYGHEKIGLLSENTHPGKLKEQLSGYQRAITESDIDYDEKNILIVQDHSTSEKLIHDFYKTRKLTAVITGSASLTFSFLKAMKRMGLACPDDLSVIGYGDEKWYDLIDTPFTTIRRDVYRTASLAASRIIEQIERPSTVPEHFSVQTTLIIRKSTQMIGRGPFGERAFSPDDITFTDEERARIRDGDFKVAISFHYGGTAWKALHERGIRDTLESFGITIVSVTDAHFDPELQIAQLEGISMQEPDAVIAIPTDDTLTAPTFKKLAKKTKLIFMSNLPAEFGTNDYISCVSVNERENGRIAATLMGEYFREKTEVKAGFINHGAPFYGTYLRDMVATQVICENYPNIRICAVSNFMKIKNAYRICKTMLHEHPDIEALYVCWDQPALQVIRALEEMGRSDVAVFTYDLDEKIGEYLIRENYVKGIGTQRPYEQGVAVGLATAKALLGSKMYKYVGVSPYTVQRCNFLKAWKDIMHEPLPEKLKRMAENHPTENISG